VITNFRDAYQLATEVRDLLKEIRDLLKRAEQIRQISAVGAVHSKSLQEIIDRERTQDGE
jgi:hypothetical protein